MYLLYPLLSSILYILAFPLNTSGYIAFIAMVPLFTLISRQKELKKATAAGAIFGLIISLYFSNPLYYSMTINPDSFFLIPAILIFFTAIIPNIIIYSLFAAIFHWISKSSALFNIVLPASLWILIDYLKELSSFILPWGLTGYTQVFTPFIQLADITGIHGVSFLIILINTMIAEIITITELETNLAQNSNRYERMLRFLKYLINNRNYKKIIYNSLLILIIISGVFTYGILKKNSVLNKSAASEKITYLMVQGNSESVERWNEASSTARYQTYIQLTKQGINDADFIVWPETVLNSSDKVNYEIMSGAAALLKDSGYFITGGIRHGKNQTTFNSIFVMKKTGLEFIYDKRKLFPYSERPFFGNTAGAFFNSPEKFHEGTSDNIYRAGKIIAGFSICFESIYPSLIRKQAGSGANILINVANDSWFGDSSVPHLQQYAMISRAVENRISVIRTANSGISFSVSPSGDTISMIPMDIRDISTGTLPVIKKRSFYTKAGNWIIAISIILILVRLLTGEMNKKKLS